MVLPYRWFTLPQLTCSPAFGQPIRSNCWPLGELWWPYDIKMTLILFLLQVFSLFQVWLNKDKDVNIGSGVHNMGSSPHVKTFTVWYMFHAWCIHIPGFVSYQRRNYRVSNFLPFIFNSNVHPVQFCNYNKFGNRKHTCLGVSQYHTK